MQARCKPCGVTWQWPGQRPAVKLTVCGYCPEHLKATRKVRDGDQVCEVKEWGSNGSEGLVTPSHWQVKR